MLTDPKDTNKKNTDTDIHEQIIANDGQEQEMQKEKEVIKNSRDELENIKGNPDVPVM